MHPSCPLVTAALAASLAVAPRAAAQSPVEYDISFPNRAHHEARIRIHYTDLPPGTLELRMSRTSPGRYALHEFAKNVYDVRALAVDGPGASVHRPNPHQWNVRGHGGEVTITYTLFADRADGTYSGIDESHAHLNAPATFMWARGLSARPVRLTVHVPEGSGWKVATQLPPAEEAPGGEGRFVFTAPDLHYFLDSPLEASDFELREWTVDGNTVRVVMHHLGTDAELDEYVEHTRAIVEAERAVYGELPDFDYGTYTFLACYLPWVSGDGMEHRNSTILTSTGSLARSMTGLLGTVAHEFFHAWNIERIRPASLEPFDFEAANMSRELWFGEGFTSYYDDLAMVRAGVIDVESFARRLGGSVNAVTNSPGRSLFSPVEMSMRAPFVDAAVSVDPVNRANIFISYYTWGAVVAAGLDLTLRSGFQGVTLDALMREMWTRHGRVERPYTVDDVEAALAAITDDADFAVDFFRRYVRGREIPDFADLLASAGLTLRKARPGEPYLALARLAPAEGGVRVASNALVGTPLYEAGADRGDLLLEMAGVRLSAPDDVRRILEERAPGDPLEIRYESRGKTRTVSVVLREDPGLEIVPLEDVDETPSEEAMRFRRAWLGG